jgi:phospholipid/cholesterol/gamma-HCH transport system substrate-binding protein
VPGIGPSLQVEEGDVLLTRAQADLSKEIGTLTQTNDNVAMISQELLQTIHKINNSPLIWSVLDDTLLLTDLHLSLGNIKASSQHINNSAALVETAMKDVRAGEGALGLLLTDKDAELKVSGILTDVNEASRRVNGLIARLDSIAATLEMSINNKGGLAYVLLNDTALAGRLGRSLDNVENGTAAFNEDMEALKHNFLTRGYFRKKDKKTNKAKIDQNEQ